MTIHTNDSIIELSAAERHKILVEWNNTQTDYPKDKCIHQLFEEQVERTPNAIAVVFEAQQLTYEELNRRANQLAHHLQSLFVKPEVLVGICVERSLEMVVGLLGILKAGGAYVPLDPSYPKERLAFMLADAGVPVLLTQKKLVEDLPEHKAQIVCLETSLRNLSEENPVSKVTPSHLAYVIYTSGSTGTPKGVVVRHQPVINLIDWVNKTFQVGSSDRILLVTSLCFDLSVYDIFGLLAAGGSIHVASESVRKNPEQLLHTLYNQPITFWDSVPAVFQQLVPFMKSPPAMTHPLRLVFLSGDWIPVTLPDTLKAAFPGTQVIGLGGATEATVWSNYYPIKEVKPQWVSIPYGKPIQNAKYYLLDQNLNPCPIGIRGALYIGGQCLASGYNDPLQTALKFIPDPFSEDGNARLYHTGDLARYLPDGNLEFLGRIDNQVKIRGFRIELGEIETVLAQHPAVQQAVVIVWEVKPGEKRLAAYIVPHQKPAPKPSELHHFLKEKLPNYMVPAAFVILEKIPLTPNGKIDRNALPTPDLEKRYINQELIAPRTPIEEVLTTIWTEVLALEQIGIHDNFFELGGHSLLIIQVISRVQETLPVELSLSSLFECPTIAELARHLETVRGNEPHRQQLPDIQPISRQQNLPLSYLQEQLWFLAQLNPNVPFYNESATIHINSTLNVTALEKSLNEILKRHEALRTSFVSVSGQPVQMIMRPPTLNLPVVDLRTLPLEQAEAMRLATEQAKLLFDFTQDILLRATLVLLSEAKYRLFLSIPHIIIDGLSLAIFLKELAVLYKAFSIGKPSPLSELPIQYVDFAYWQRQQLSADIVDSQVSYWKTRLGDNLPVLQLPTDHQRPVTPTFRGAKQYLVLSKNLTEELKTLSQQQGVTLFMTLLAAFKTLLYRYSGQDDIVVGTVAAVRNRPELEHLIGYFLNTVVLRTDMSGTPTFQQLLARVREVTLGAMAHNDLPFEKLVETIHIERNFGQTPLFQVGFTIEPPMPSIDLGWTLTQSDIDNGTAKFDLSLGLEEKPEGLSGRIEYSTDLFDAPTISRMIGHFQILLEGIVANPLERISELPMLTERERHQLLVQWNDTQRDYPKDKCIHHLFEAQVEQTPNNVAVVFEDKQLTYRELNAKANQIAHYLQTLGIKQEVLVGICVERSIEMVIGLLGILKAGNAYLPLDQAYPKARLAFMLEDSQVSVLLTQSSLKEGLPETTARVVCLDVEVETLSQFAEENIRSEVGPANLAYVIYTSGSTGQPKGVLIAHQGLCNLAQAQVQTFNLQSDSRILQFASLSFDASIWEIVMGLCSGARICLANSNSLLPGPSLIQLLHKQAITHLTLPPTALAVLPTEKLLDLQYIIVAGEACSPDLIAQWSKNRHFFNAYGPSEATVCATIAECTDNQQKPPIGRPIANTQIYILDQYLQPVPIGVPGELHIGGTGLARGYLNHPDLTAEKFIKNPFSDDPNARIYKTGDLARYLPDGNIEYLGRIDNQVKIRGFRIELGEIEAALGQHPVVKENVVIVHETAQTDKLLVAYLVLHQGQRIENTDIRGFLMSLLPDYMIPSAFVRLEAMPLTPNGKIDRHALLKESVESLSLSEKTFVAPREALELQLARIWEEVLDVYPVGVQDDFFELGGHSLLAVRLMAEIQQQFGKNISLATLFQGATIEQLAKIIRQRSQAWSPLVAIQPHGSKPPFFCMPGSGGNVIYFHQLAHHLGTEQPFYALQARGLDGESAPFTCVEDIAEYYLEAIRTVQPQGPYLLGGHSFGALVAFEMAQQLHRQGQNVARLAVLDLPALRPDREPIELDWDDAQWMALIAQILEALSGKTLGLSFNDFQALDADAQLNLLKQRLESVNLLPVDAKINTVRGIAQVIKADELAFLRYVPLAGSPNRITLFKTSDVYQDELGMLGEIPDDPLLGWGRLSTEPVEVLMVPGTHTTMLTEPDVQVLADKLKECLDKVQSA
jgi:amino acid adenylation domain-containing protein